METLTKKQKYARDYHKRNAEKIRAQKQASYHASKSKKGKPTVAKPVKLSKATDFNGTLKNKEDHTELPKKKALTEEQINQREARRRLEDIKMMKELGLSEADF